MARKVLIVDDDAAILRSTRILLEDIGFEVHTCAEASEAIEAVRRVRPDVVLHDVLMPGLRIEQRIQEIQADPLIGKTPVVLFTASIDPSVGRLRTKAEGLLEKPFAVAELEAAIDSALSNSVVSLVPDEPPKRYRRAEETNQGLEAIGD